MAETTSLLKQTVPTTATAKTNNYGSLEINVEELGSGSPLPNIESNNDSDGDKQKSPLRFLKVILQLTMIFLISCFLVYSILIVFLPPLTEEQRHLLHIPTGFKDLQTLNKLLSETVENYYINLLIIFTVSYIFLQTFSIPGSMWLSILGGALFGWLEALLLVCFCSSVGSSNCFLLSKKYGRKLVKDRYSERLDRLANQLQSHSHNLLNYIVVLRLSPFPPNWFANLAAPHLGVPLKIFFIGTFFGVAPPSFIHVQAGLTINSITNDSDFKIFTFKNVGVLVLVGAAVLLPVWYRKRVESHSETNQESDLGEEVHDQQNRHHQSSSLSSS